MSFLHGPRGQSEVLGYIVIFSVVFLSLGSIHVSGITSLDSHQATAELNNAEQAMRVFSSNIADITAQESPRRSVELKTRDSTVETTARTNITITVTETDTGTETEVTNTSMRGFAYRSDAGNLVYETGAILRTQDGGAVIRDTPQFTFHEDRVILNIVRLGGQASFQQSGTSLAVLEHDTARSTTTYETSDNDQNVTITLETHPDRAPAWETYFDEQGLEQVRSDPDNGTLTYKYSQTNEVLIRETFIWVRIED